MPRILFLVLMTLGAAKGFAALPYFTFNLPWDDGSENAASVAFLNDHVAGSQGFVFVDGNGHLATSAGRLRFWGTNAVFGGCFPSLIDAPKVSVRLAKAGFNIIRFHHMDFYPAPQGLWEDAAPDRDLDPANLGRLDHFIYQLKQRGIYSNLNLVVARPFNPGVELHPDILLINDWKVRAVLGFFDPAQQALQKDYANKLLNHVNPYTGNAYKNEPAIAFVEINNENGLVQAFKSGQLDSLPTYYKDMLKAQWNAWLQAKYADQAALMASWNSVSASAGPEMMVNGSFATGLSNWNPEQQGAPPAVAGFSVTAEGPSGTASARVNVTSVGQMGWHVQLNQGNKNVTAGQPYTLRFWAKADSNRTISVDLGMNHAPWGGLGFSSNLNLTSAWQYFEFVLNPNASDANARINFSNMGLQLGTFWFAQVSLKNEGLLGLYPDENLAAGTMRNYLQNGDSARTTDGLKDWLRFLLATEEAYWLDLKAHLQGTLGVQSLVMGTIIGCSTPNLMAQMDAVDTHAYWRHPNFPGIPWDAVDWYVSNSAMPNLPSQSIPAALSMQAVQAKPLSLTELNTPYPNTHEADLLPIMAAYGGLQDFDAIYPFAYHGGLDDWGASTALNFFDFKPNVVKMSQMPLAALLFRRGDFAPAAQLVAVPMSREDEVSQLVPAGAWSLVNADTAGEDPRAGLIHRVRIIPQGGTAPGGALAPGSTAVGGSVLTADTGQLRWDNSIGGAGVVSGDSPRAKMVAGWGGGRTFYLSGVTLSPGASLQGGYGAYMVASLDGLSISASTRLLISAAGLQRNVGAVYYQYPSTPISFPPAESANVTLRNQWGSGPPEVEGLPATVVLPFTPAQVQAWALGPTGARGAALTVGNSGGFASLALSASYGTLWYEVEVNHASYSPTPSRTPTPQLSPTPTLTVTATPTPVQEWTWDDFETGWSPQPWQAYADTANGGTVYSVSRLTGTANVAEGFYAWETNVNTGNPGSWGGGWLINSPYGTRQALGYQDLSGVAYLEMWIYSDTAGVRVRPTLSEAGNTATAVNGADGEVWESSNGAWTTLTQAGQWTQFVYPLANFRDKPFWPYNPTSIGNDTMDLSGVAWVSLEWDGNQGANVRLLVDAVRFFRVPGTPTPSRTPTPFQSPSPTRSMSPSATPSASPSGSATASPTLTASPSPSESPVVSPTPSFTESQTFTPTPALSPTPTSSLTWTWTHSPTPSPVPPSASPTPDLSGPLEIRSHFPVPHPAGDSSVLAVELKGPCETLSLKIYSSGYGLARGPLLFKGPFVPGWQTLALDLGGLANGSYFYVLEAEGRGSRLRSSAGRLFVAR